MAAMSEQSAPGSQDLFSEVLDEVLASLPSDRRGPALQNLDIVAEDEPPGGQSILGQYRGIPLPRRRYTGLRARKFFPTESASSLVRSRDWPAATQNACAGRPSALCSTRSQSSSGSTTSG
jgi:hypothetical protein